MSNKPVCEKCGEPELDSYGTGKRSVYVPPNDTTFTCSKCVTRSIVKEDDDKKHKLQPA